VLAGPEEYGNEEPCGAPALVVGDGERS